LDACFATKLPIVWRYSSSDHDFEKATTRLPGAHNATAADSVIKVNGMQTVDASWFFL
jgi:hypothetical protein